MAMADSTEWLTVPAMTIWVSLALVLLALLLEVVVKRAGNKPVSAPLPPGSLGWPLGVGETIDFIRSLGVAKERGTDFFRKRREKYGNVFKTHLLGSPTVVVAGVEAQKLVLLKENRLVQAAYLDCFVHLFGKKALTSAVGEAYKRHRRLMQHPFSPGALRTHLHKMEQLTLSTLSSWEGKEVLVLDECLKLTFSTILDIVLSLKPGPIWERLWRSFNVFMKAGVSLPFNIPGTNFHKAMKARGQMVQVFQQELQKRRQAGKLGEDILGILLKGQEDTGGESFSDEEILDNLVLLLFAGFDTSGAALTTVIQHLCQHPEHLKILQDEHDLIQQHLRASNQSLTWDALKDMPYTTMTTSEAIRFASVANVIFRQSLEDFEFEGYKLPKGWQICLDRDASHFDPEIFKDPHTFNPARFEENIPPYAFNPFGAGQRNCLGMELAKMEILVFIHHLVTKYSWRMTSDDVTKDYSAMVPTIKNRLPVHFEKRGHY